MAENNNKPACLISYETQTSNILLRGIEDNKAKFTQMRQTSFSYTIFSSRIEINRAIQRLHWFPQFPIKMNVITITM